MNRIRIDPAALCPYFDIIMGGSIGTFRRLVMQMGLALFASAAIPLKGLELMWEEIVPDYREDPRYSGCINFLNGFEGAFYLAVCVGPFSVFRSEDGESWTEIWPGGRGTEAIRLSNGQVLLFGDVRPEIAIGDGADWEIREVAPEVTPSKSIITTAAEGEGRLVLGGYTSISSNYVPAWWVSTDEGETFIYFSDEDYTDTLSQFPEISSIAYGNDVFVAVGLRGEVWFSETGESWTRHTLPQLEFGTQMVEDLLATVVFRDGYFWAAGLHETVYRSTDGSTWELLFSSGTSRFLDTFLFVGNTIYVAGRTGYLIWSNDRGETWSKDPYRPGPKNNLTGGQGHVFAGEYIAPAGGPIGPDTHIGYEFWDPATIFRVAYTEGKWLVLTTQSAFFGEPDPSTLRFLDSAVTADGFHFQHPWFGWFTLRSGDWVYHFNLGWIYSNSPADANVWIYTSGLEWIFTSDGFWPYFFHSRSGNWGYYSGGSDWFWNESQGKWQPRGSFGQG